MFSINAYLLLVEPLKILSQRYQIRFKLVGACAVENLYTAFGKIENLKRFYESLENAALLEIVAKYDNKEETRLGNNGISLSGGQRQRISIARELCKNSQILFMDEATSSLDSETELIIHKNISNLKGHKTIIIVAHRLATIKHADKIVLFSNGRIKKIGDFKTLSENDPCFKKIVKNQIL